MWFSEKVEKRNVMLMDLWFFWNWLRIDWLIDGFNYCMMIYYLIVFGNDVMILLFMEIIYSCDFDYYVMFLGIVLCKVK